MNLNQKKFIQIGCIVLTAVLLLTGISSIAFVLASPKSQPGVQLLAAGVDLGYGTVTLVFRQGDERINSNMSGTNSWYNEVRGEYLRYRDYVQARYDAWESENVTEDPVEPVNAAPAAAESTAATAAAVQQAEEVANVLSAQPTEGTVPAETTAATEAAAEPTESTTEPTEATTQPTEAATEPTEAATEPTEAMKQEMVFQEAPALKAAAPAITPADIPETLQIFEEFSIVVPINAAGNIIMPGIDFLSTLAAGNATLTAQAQAWQLDPETFWFGDPSDTDALNNGKLWAYSFTGWTSAVNRDGNDNRYTNTINTIQPGDVIVPGAHQLQNDGSPDSYYKDLNIYPSNIEIKDGATIVFDAVWGQCSFVRNPYDTMVYKEQTYNNNGNTRYVVDTDKCVNADGSKTLKAWDYKDANGNKCIYKDPFTVEQIGTDKNTKGTYTLNYGNDPDNPIASIDYLYGYRYKYETAEHGNFRRTSSRGMKKGDVIAQNAYNRVVMLIGTMDYIKHDKQRTNIYGMDLSITYYGVTTLNNQDTSDPNITTHATYDINYIYTSATYKSLQPGKDTSGTVHLFRYRQKGLSNSMRGNFRFDNIQLCSITETGKSEGNASLGTAGLDKLLNVAPSNQVESDFDDASCIGDIGTRYFETTARFVQPNDNSGGLIILRPKDCLEVVKINGGYFSTLEIAWSGSSDQGRREWQVGRNVRVDYIRAGTGTSEVEPNSDTSPWLIKDSEFLLVVTGGTVGGSVVGSSRAAWSYVTGSRYLGFYGDPTREGSEYNPVIGTNTSHCIYGAEYASIFNDVTITIKNCTITGSVFGGGYASSANVYGDVTINIENSTVNGAVYGGGNMGNIYPKRTPFLGDGWGTDPGANGTGGGNVRLNIKNSDVKGHVYGGGKGGTLTNTASNTSAGSAAEGWYPEGWENTPMGPRGLGSPAYIQESGAIIYTVYKWAKSISANNVTAYEYEGVATLSLAIVEKNVTMNISGGHMYKNVYGSGNLGKVLGDVTMNISSCQVDGDVYGAGDGVTQPAGVTLYSSEKYKNYSYVPPRYTVDSAGKVTFTQQKVNGTVVSDGKNKLLELGVFNWSDDPAVLAAGGIDYQNNLIYSPHMTGWGTVNGSTYVTLNSATVKGYVYGGGNKGEVGQNSSVTFNSGSAHAVYGGGKQAKVSGNSTVNIGGGTFTYVFGGGLKGEVAKNATLTITGGTFNSNVYGGGDEARVGQNTTVTVSGGSFANCLYGGGYSNTGEVGGSSAVTVQGSATIAKSVYGGGLNGKITQNATVTIGGTSVIKDEVFGGGNQADIGGNTTVTLNAGPKIGDAGEEGVYGGGNKGAVGGTSTVNVNGLNAFNNLHNTAPKPWAIYGGGNEGVVGGDVTVNLKDGHLANLFGGAKRADIGGKVTLNITGGDVVYAYGSNCYDGDITGDVVVNMSNGTIGDRIVGCGWKADYSGDSYLNISGGTVKKNVYGGGEEAAAGNVHVHFSGGTVTENIFGGGLNAHTNSVYLEMTDGSVAGIRGGGYNGTTGDIQIEISGGYISSNIYGGGENGDSGDVLLNISGGEGGSVNGNSLSGGFVFGGGAKAAVGNVELNLSGGTYNYVLGGGDGSLPSGPADVNGNIVNNLSGSFVIRGFFRGGSMRHSTVSGNITTNMSGGTIEGTVYCFAGGCHGIDYYSDSGLGAQTHVLGNITTNIVGGTLKGTLFGGSLGPYSYVNDATAMAAVNTDCSGDITVNISGNAAISKNVFGGTAAANVYGRVVTNIGGSVTIDGTTYTANGLTIGGSVYGGNEQYGNVFGEDSDAAPIEVNVAGGTINGSVYGGHYMGGVVGDGLASENTVLNISGGAVKGSVYGGSQEVNTSNVATNVNISNTNNTAVPIAIGGSVFGGGYNGEVGSTDVKLQNTSTCAAITVAGDVFGGGKGSMSVSGTTAKVLGETKVLIDLYTNLTATETSSSVDDLSGEAKVTPSITVKNKIGGSVYGGGDIAQVGVGTINRGSNSATVTEAGSTHVVVKSGNILGSVFGGGNGVPTSGTYDVDMGTVFGSTHVDITGGYVHTNVYGGGRQSHLYAPTVNNVVGKASEVHIDQTGNGTIVIGGSVFGGGDRGEGASLNAAAPTVVGDTDVRITGSPTNCKVYFIQGGVYGDGNLCVVKGTRTITMKDFTTGNTDYLKTFFSLQRADKVILDNTDIVLQGALDLVDEGDATLYSVNRVDSLEMRNGSTIKLTSIVKYLGALSSDVETAREFIKEGNNGTNGYTDVPPVSPLTDSEINAYRADTTRAKNTVCVANGLYLEVIRQSDGEYGPVTGLYTLQLLRAVPGEGGGFVYADIATSTGDFICETKKANANVYLNVIDNVGGLTNGVGTYYYWYINGETISYNTTVTAHIGLADTAFSSSFYIPEHSEQLEYVLFGVKVNDVLANAVTGNSASMTLVQKSTGLTGNQIAIELRLDGEPMGFLKYETGVWCVQLTDGTAMSGYDGRVGEIAENTLRSDVTVGSGEGKVEWILHKSTSISSELRGMQVDTEIDLFDKQGNIYSAGTGILVLSADMNIVRLNPSQSFYRVDSRFFGQGISPDKEVSITGKSAFTVEFHTYYVPLAYPGSMTWTLKTTENRYYMSRQGGWVTTDAAGNVIAYSGSTKPTKNSAGEYVAGDEVFTLQSTGNPVSNALPKGTKIIMIDATGGDREYYYYLCNEAKTQISLNEFSLMGTKSSIVSQYTAVKPDFMAVYDSQSATRVDETLFFIFDFSQVTWSSNNAFSGGVVLEHMYNGMDIMDHVKMNQSGTSTSYVRDFPEAARYQVNPATDAVDSMTVNAAGGDNVTLTVQVNRDSAWTNTQFNEQNYTLRIEWMNGQTAQSMPNGLYMTYGGRNYYPSNGNMDVVVPLSIPETSYTSTHQITIDSILGALSESMGTSGTLRVTLYNAANGSYYNQLTTDLTGTADYTLNAEPETALGVACTNDNRIFAPNEVMQFKYKAIGSDEKVIVEVFKKASNSEYNEVALSDVFSNATANLAPGTDLSKAWTVTGSTGTYRLVFVYADRTEYMNIIIQ